MQTGTAGRDLSQPHLLPGTLKQTGTVPGLLRGCVAERELQGPVPLGWPCWEGRCHPAHEGQGMERQTLLSVPVGISPVPVFQRQGPM